METRSIFPHLAKSGSLGSMNRPGRGLRGRGCGDQRGLGVSLYIVFANAAAGTGAFDFVDIDTDFASQAAGGRSRGNRFAVFGSGNLAQLHRHGKRGWTRHGLIRRQRLFLGLALGANRGLKGKARASLTGDMLDRPSRRTNRRGRR
jgi:hypothetical protein